MKRRIYSEAIAGLTSLGLLASCLPSYDIVDGQQNVGGQSNSVSNQPRTGGASGGSHTGGASGSITVSLVNTGGRISSTIGGAGDVGGNKANGGTSAPGGVGGVTSTVGTKSTGSSPAAGGISSTGGTNSAGGASSTGGTATGGVATGGAADASTSIGGGACVPDTTKSCYSCASTNNSQLLNACSSSYCAPVDNVARNVPNPLPAIP